MRSAVRAPFRSVGVLSLVMYVRPLWDRANASYRWHRRRRKTHWEANEDGSIARASAAVAFVLLMWTLMLWPWFE